MTQIQRDSRRPLYVKVSTRPQLRGCWSVNVSKSGIGLTATPREGEPIPAEGDSIDLEFELPDAGAALRARAKVRWRADSSAGSGRLAVSLGATFEHFAGDDQLRLHSYLAGYRTQVVCAFASPRELTTVREALAGEMELHACETAEQVEVALGRGDVAVLLICGEDAIQAQQLIGALTGRQQGPADPAAAPLRDLAPRVVHCAPAPVEELVRLFNDGHLFRALARPIGARALRAAMLDASREHGVRLEQRRVALSLERALLRRQLGAQEAGQGVEESVELGFHSPPMRGVLEMVKVAAPHRVAVLLQGETGTGKEVLAGRLHALSPRAAAPFVVQDCGALTETLLESELFGHARGAFTGAVGEHPGLFSLADGGTIFLDEIENTSANLQAKLLRVLETGDVRPVGGTQTQRVDVRILAASNRNLAAEVRAGRFRADLFYRLNTFTIEVPPLRERREDILPLARHFLARFGVAMAKPGQVLSPAAEAALLFAPWPGNVRELRNAMERAVLLTPPEAPIGVQALPPGISAEPAASGGGGASLKERLEVMERQIIHEALAQSGGVIRKAARLLRTDPVTLGRKVKRHRLSSA